MGEHRRRSDGSSARRSLRQPGGKGTAVTDTALFQLTYRLKLDAPALLTTLSGDPNTVEGKRAIPGSSLLGAFAGRWVQQHHLGMTAHTDPDFAWLFLRGGLTFLNAYPEDVRADQVRLLPVPLSFRTAKQDRTRVYDEAVERVQEADTRVGGFGRLIVGDEGDDAGIVTLQPTTRLRLHTARADRLLGRSTEHGGALFAYEALEGGQTFIGSMLGSEDDVRRLQRDLGWTAVSPFTCSMGRSRSAEYGGQVRLTLLQPGPTAFAPEAPAATRQEPDGQLVLTLTSHLLPVPDSTSSGRLSFPFAALAGALTAAGLAADAEALAQGCRAITQPVLVGGYSGIWGMPRPQIAGFAAGSVFCFPSWSSPLDAAAFLHIEQGALGQRTAEGFGRFVLNWHGGHDRYSMRTDPTPVRPPKPASPPPETFRHVALDLARTWARERTVAEALRFAQACPGQHLPSPSLLRRVSGLLARLDLASAPLLQDQLAALARPAKQGLQECLVDGHCLLYWLELCCSPDIADQTAARSQLFRLQEADVPPDLRAVLPDVDQALAAPEQQAALASLFMQVALEEMARRQRSRKEGSA